MPEFGPMREPFCLPGWGRDEPELADDPRRMTPVRIRPMLAAVAALLLAGGGAVAFAGDRAAASADLGAPPTLGEQLRYVGRDTLTGMPAAVDDRFIAQVAHDIERYGKDERQPAPPPAATGTDVATLTVVKLGMKVVPVKRYGLDAFGRLEVPQDSDTVGWNPAYNDLPGAGGATFFAAHFEYAGRPGVFFKLSTLALGDEITVGLSDGSSHRYRVSSPVDYALATIDMGALLYGREGMESITLMTCSGPPGADGYPLRTVVLAERLP